VFQKSILFHHMLRYGYVHHMFEVWINLLMGLRIYWEEFEYEVSEWNGVLGWKLFMLLTVAVLLVQAGCGLVAWLSGIHTAKSASINCNLPTVRWLYTDTVKYGYVCHSHLLSGL
jgi:hypothetical protein